MRGDKNGFTHRIQIKEEGRVIGEREVVSYRGLLDLVHKDRVKEIRTTLIQAPSKENGETAIVHVLVHTSRGRFSAIGDANPQNVSRKILPHIVRMAETRAEARAMRKAVNIGMVALDDLGDDLADDVTYESTFVPATGARRPANDTGPANGHDRTPIAPPTSVPPSASRMAQDNRPQNDTRASEQQRKYLYALLSERGVTGEAARELCHRELNVASFNDATRAAVSSLIDRLKNGGSAYSNGHAQSEPGEHG